MGYVQTEKESEPLTVTRDLENGPGAGFAFVKMAIEQGAAGAMEEPIAFLINAAPAPESPTRSCGAYPSSASAACGAESSFWAGWGDGCRCPAARWRRPAVRGCRNASSDSCRAAVP